MSTDEILPRKPLVLGSERWDPDEMLQWTVEEVVTMLMSSYVWNPNQKNMDNVQLDVIWKKLTNHFIPHKVAAVIRPLWVERSQTTTFDLMPFDDSRASGILTMDYHLFVPYSSPETSCTTCYPLLILLLAFRYFLDPWCSATQTICIGFSPGAPLIFLMSFFA